MVPSYAEIIVYAICEISSPPPRFHVRTIRKKCEKRSRGVTVQGLRFIRSLYLISERWFNVSHTDKFNRPDRNSSSSEITISGCMVGVIPGRCRKSQKRNANSRDRTHVDEARARRPAARHCRRRRVKPLETQNLISNMDLTNEFRGFDANLSVILCWRSSLQTHLKEMKREEVMGRQRLPPRRRRRRCCCCKPLLVILNDDEDDDVLRD